MTDVTRILLAIEQGDPKAAEQLLPLVYDELRKLAAQKLAQEKPGQTLQATALVHEAYLRLVGGGRGPALGRPRPLLRRRRRGHAPHPRRQRPPQAAPSSAAAGRQRVDLERAEPAVADASDEDLLALDEALTGWPARAREAAELVKLRFFAGLTLDEAAAALGLARRTADRYWAYARAWLYELLSDWPGPGDGAF